MRFSLLWTAAWLALSQGLAGCAATKAMVRYEEYHTRYKDASVLESGAAREHVIEQLGEPIASATRKDGSVVDLYRFDPHRPSGTPSYFPAIGHIGLSIVTLGLWEIAGSDLEEALKARPLTHLLVYDAGGRLAEYSSMPEWRPASVAEPERKKCEQHALLVAARVTAAAARNPLVRFKDSFRVDRQRDNAYHHAWIGCLLPHYARR